MLLILLFFGAAKAQPEAPLPPFDGNRAEVASTEAFIFYSHFWLNLHDALYEIAQIGSDGELEKTCRNALTPQQTRDWQAAVAFYRENMAPRHHRRDDLMVAIRYRLTGLPAERVATVEPDSVLAVLKIAAPAYKACMWAQQNDRNRQWIAALMPLLERYQTAIIEQLCKYYQASWPEAAIPVDVASYASRAGANTVSRPGHIMMSSINSGYKKYAALEMVFHEASHLMIGSGFGKIDSYLQEASRAFDEKTPFNLWHAILFYTSGTVVQKLLAENGIADYTPYVYKQGLFERAWSRYQKPIEQFWQPYLDGEVDLQTAAHNVVKAIYQK